MFCENPFFWTYDVFNKGVANLWRHQFYWWKSLQRSFIWAIVGCLATSESIILGIWDILAHSSSLEGEKYRIIKYPRVLCTVFGKTLVVRFDVFFALLVFLAVLRGLFWRKLKRSEDKVQVLVRQFFTFIIIKLVFETCKFEFLFSLSKTMFM